MAAPALKWPGAKWRLADWIVSQMPPHSSYLEPFFGSGAVFFTKSPSSAETINDIDGSVVNFFRVLREQPDALIETLCLTPWARAEYEEAYTQAGTPLEDARRFAVRLWQAYGARTSGTTGWRNDVQGTLGTTVTDVWAKLPQRLAEAAKRLKHAQVENRPALDVLARFSFPNVLVYADPPYPLSTRSTVMYAHEMTDDDHLQLLAALDLHPGPVLLSGYACDLYDDRLKYWTRLTKKASAEGGREREEVLWLNPTAAAKNGQQVPLTF